MIREDERKMFISLRRGIVDVVCLHVQKGVICFLAACMAAATELLLLIKATGAAKPMSML